MNRITRRRFLGAAAASGVAYAFARMPRVTYAQMTGGGSFADYKALVCVFLFGGNDSWNMIVPSSNAEYSEYAASRQNLAVPQGSLLPLQLAVPDASGWSFGVNSAMPGLQELFNTGRAAIVANVGPLIAPTTLEQYESFSVPLPPQLFSHNDQQDQWHSLKGREVSKSGWAGRIADVLAGQVTQQKLALNVSLAGQTLYQAGAVSVPYTIGPAGPTPFLGLGAMGEADLRQAFESLANADYDTMYERTFATVQQRALEFGERVSTALAGAPELTSLPDNPQTPLSGLATQLRTVAKLIAVRNELEMSRQIFFVAMGGFDTHDSQNDDQPALLSTVSDALKRFDDGMQQLGVSESVVAFTQSDFGRTLTSNGDGTDHAWGGVQVVTGGAVAGGRIYGEYPLLRIGARVASGHRADDVGAGRFIPTISSDQYATTLARWFGVPEADLPVVARSIANFSVGDLGLLV